MAILPTSALIRTRKLDLPTSALIRTRKLEKGTDYKVYIVIVLLTSLWWRKLCHTNLSRKTLKSSDGKTANYIILLHQVFAVPQMDDYDVACKHYYCCWSRWKNIIPRQYWGGATSRFENFGRPCSTLSCLCVSSDSLLLKMTQEMTNNNVASTVFVSLLNE
jgi:hypothetical protein